MGLGFQPRSGQAWVGALETAFSAYTLPAISSLITNRDPVNEPTPAQTPATLLKTEAESGIATSRSPRGRKAGLNPTVHSGRMAVSALLGESPSPS